MSLVKAQIKHYKEKDFKTAYSLLQNMILLTIANLRLHKDFKDIKGLEAVICELTDVLAIAELELSRNE